MKLEKVFILIALVVGLWFLFGSNILVANSGNAENNKYESIEQRVELAKSQGMTDSTIYGAVITEFANEDPNIYEEALRYKYDELNAQYTKLRDATLLYVASQGLNQTVNSYQPLSCNTTVRDYSSFSTANTHCW